MDNNERPTIKSRVFDKQLTAYRYAVESQAEFCAGKIIEAADVFAAERYEAGELSATKVYIDIVSHMRARAERAEAALAEAKESVVLLTKQNFTLFDKAKEAALASRPAVDAAAIVDYVYDQVGFKARDALVADVEALILLAQGGNPSEIPNSSTPTECSKDPNCCPNNEGYGCDCSASSTSQQTTASANGPVMTAPFPGMDKPWTEAKKAELSAVLEKHNKPAEQQGMFQKFDVRRVDGSDAPGGKHHGCRYFVLDLNHDAHAPAAMTAYGISCAATHSELSADILREFPAQAAQPHDEDAAIRLRAICNRLGIGDHVPQDNATLWGAAFAVLGQVRAALDKQAAQPAGDERAAFEVEYRKIHDFPEDAELSSLDRRITDAWVLWQAATRRAAIATQQPPQKPVTD